MNPIRILLADDHVIVRMGLKSLLEDSPDMTVVGEAQNGIEAVAEALRLQPDVVIMDLMMPRKDGVAATADLHKKLPSAKVVILTTYSTSDGISHAMDSGASGALLKNTANTELVPAIRAVMQGKTYLSREVRRLFAEDPPAQTLTDRQRAILESLVRGLSNDDIAKQFGIAEITVRNHLVTIFDKIGAGSRTEAVAITLRKQLLKL